MTDQKLKIKRGQGGQPEIREKYDNLLQNLRQYRRVIVAYSGGVDSVFLLRAAVEALGPRNVLACIGVSESLAKSEHRQAVELAGEMGAQVQEVQPAEMSNPDYQANPANRCFYCKSELYGLLRDLAAQRGYDKVLCGTNADDRSDFRPGLQAAKKFNIASPLEELTKAEIRELSRELGLPTWNKPAQPCLASRMAYGTPITAAKLAQVERGEEFLRGLGLRELRVRHHESVARIEVPAERISELLNRREEIVRFFKELGFTYVTLDLQGFRSGSGNEVLK